MKSLEQSI